MLDSPRTIEPTSADFAPARRWALPPVPVETAALDRERSCHRYSFSDFMNAAAALIFSMPIIGPY